MNPRIDDLRGALHAEADDTTWPSADHTLAAVETRVGRQRRRRMAGLAAATAVALALVGSVVVLGRPDPNAAPRPAHSITSDLARIHGDKHFPEYTAGLRRLAVLEVPFATPDTPQHRLSVDPAPGADLYAVARCPQDKAGAGPESPARNEGARVHVGDVTVPCFPQDLFRTMAWPQRLDGDQSGLTVWAVANADPLSQSGSGSTPTVPGDAVAELAIYETVPWSDYPFAKSRPLGRAAAITKTRARGGGPPMSQVVKSIEGRGPTGNGRTTFTVPYDQALSMEILTTAPGQFRIKVDGKPLFGTQATRRDSILPWLFPADFRQGWIGCWEAHGCGWGPLGVAAAGRPTKKGQPITYTLEARNFADPHASWTVTFGKDR